MITDADQNINSNNLKSISYLHNTHVHVTFKIMPLTNVEMEFLELAVELSAENVRSGRGGPFGALVVRENVIIGRGSNSVTRTNDPTAHAEIVAIREACSTIGNFQLTDCDIYSSCEPCPMCIGAIYWARPRRIIYANTAQDAADIDFDDAFIYKELKVPEGQRSIQFVRQSLDSALVVFQAWENSATKVEY